MFEEAEFEDHSIQLQPGDCLYIYSDGITEATNEQKDMLNTEGLIQIVDQARGLPLDERIREVMEGLRKWCGSAPFADDVSILALEMCEAVDEAAE